MPLNHTSVKAPGQPLAAVVDWNASHVITGGVLDIGANNFIVDTNVLFVDAATNRVGIGTASPDKPLHVKTTSNTIVKIEAGGAAKYAELDLIPTTTGDVYITYGLAGGGNDFHLYSNKVGIADVMLVDEDGNVGIGTINPTDALHIEKSGAAASIRLSSTSHNNKDFRLFVSGPGADYNTLYLRGEQTTGGDDFAEIMVWNNIGNVGIGTTSPAVSAKLELSTTTGALLLSRMTTAQRNALTAVNGMIIYNSDTNKIEGYENAAWVDI